MWSVVNTKVPAVLQLIATQVVFSSSFLPVYEYIGIQLFACLKRRKTTTLIVTLDYVQKVQNDSYMIQLIMKRQWRKVQS